MDRGAWWASVHGVSENARSWEALGEARPGQSSLSAGALRYRAWALAHQALLSIGFPRQEHWSGLPFPSPEDLPDPGIKAGRGEAKDSAPVLERSPGEGNGYSLQYSCLENPMDRGAWWATVHRVTQSRTRLKRLSTHDHQELVAQKSAGHQAWVPGAGSPCLGPLGVSLYTLHF